MIPFLLGIFYRIFPCHRRLEVRLVSYTTAERLLTRSRHLPDGRRWTLAREEDNNRVVGRVFLERRERIWS